MVNLRPTRLLTRDEFRESVFARDNHQCVMCQAPAADAHHILERRLFADGGYYIDNGASLCGSCHIKAEQTLLSPADIRRAAGIDNIILPEHLYSDNCYTKWGDIVLPNGTRTKGELFYDESVQKILASGCMLSTYTDYVKYPRTYHLPWSACVSEDDRVAPSLDHLQGTEIIVTEKLDGENTTLYKKYIHARSVDSRNHPSRNWVKNFWGTIAHEIPEGWRICGENMYATHSISYVDLESYFYGFSIWNSSNQCLGWDETSEWFELLGIVPVPVLYRGPFDPRILEEFASRLDPQKTEGYVIRPAASFSYGAFRNSVYKYVRPDHIRTVKHWMHGQPIIPNKLKHDHTARNTDN